MMRWAAASLVAAHLVAAQLVAAAVLTQARAADLAPPRLAALPFTLVNTSPAPSTPEELARLRRLDSQLQRELTARFTLMDIAPAAGQLALVDNIRSCNGCELDIAHSLGATQVSYGWVQKVSNLILNVNLVFEDATTGKVLRAGSVDIRGNTDESWTRGLRYLIAEELFRTD